ncbi:alkyl/aryl-sulfatase [Roseibium sp.]|uniref:alkyl/aryl-sulfatase n=1 Tax=Roseibium sp. TaxID=1936156 RepID=UPI003266D963
MPNEALLAHDRTQFRKEIIELAPGVWGAVGYAASCQFMIEGGNSVTIVDTSESTRAAENVLAEFRKRCAKPVGRIIYTHSHRDHISGASVFAQGRQIPILAQADFKSDLVDNDPDEISPARALGRRTRAQFGFGLSAQERVSIGCGPGDRPLEGLGAGFVPPNQLISEDCTYDLDGVPARLLAAPGETADHMVVWLPDTRVLLCGDNWYHAFPNLYAIRGTPYRDFAAWAHSLDRLAGLGARVLGPGHTRPVFGEAQVRDVLTSTRDAIFHVMSETARMMDEGLGLEEIAATISLPGHLASKPWLGEFYGKVGWSARAYAVGTLGWYDGNPSNLGAMTAKRRAKHMARLAGGSEALDQAARATRDKQWCLELCDHLMALEVPALEASTRDLKAATLSLLAEDEINATARNTYLWEAKRLLSSEKRTADA